MIFFCYSLLFYRFVSLNSMACPYYNLNQSMQSLKGIQTPFLKLQTLKLQDIEPATQFLTNFFSTKHNLSEAQQKSLPPILHMNLIVPLRNNWSFKVCDHEAIYGVTLQMDVIDFLASPASPNSQKLLLRIGHDSEQLMRILEKLPQNRGENLMVVFHAVTQMDLGNMKQFFKQIMTTIKLTGWKNVLITTNNPFHWLKYGANVLGQIGDSNEMGNKNYLVQFQLAGKTRHALQPKL